MTIDRQNHPCTETYTIGPALFECAGHYYDDETLIYLAHRRQEHRGLIVHRSASPGMDGDAELTWFTVAPSAPYAESGET